MVALQDYPALLPAITRTGKSAKNLYAQPFSPPTALAAYRAEANPGKFYLPNLNGQFLRGWGDERGVDGGRSFGVRN